MLGGPVDCRPDAPGSRRLSIAASVGGRGARRLQGTRKTRCGAFTSKIGRNRRTLRPRSSPSIGLAQRPVAPVTGHGGSLAEAVGGRVGGARKERGSGEKTREVSKRS